MRLVGSSTRYYVHLRIIRIAADYARSVMMAESYCAYTSQLVLTSCARAITDRDARLAVGLMAKHPEAAKHLEIHAGRPRLIDPHLFAQDFDHAKTIYFNQRLEHARAMAEQNIKFKQSAERLAARMRMWSPFGRRLYLAGILMNGSITRTAVGGVKALAAAWRPIFSEKNS